MALQLSNVSLKVGAETHLADIDLTLESGLTVMIGQTLAGKTSLMRLMAGLDRPTSGKLIVDGQDVTGTAVQKRSVAMVFQQFINYPSMTVYNNIASPLKISGINKSEISRRVGEVVEMLHLEPYLQRLPGELSGGQQQRTAMARALIKDADLLLFDEPLVNLDYKLREELRNEMRDIFTHRKAIVVYATTEPLEALLLGGNTVVLDKGRILQHGSTLDVFHNPANSRVGKIFSDPPMNVIAGEIGNNEAILGGAVRMPVPGHMSALPDGKYYFGVRANHLSITPRTANDIEISACTELSEISGSETFIHVSHNNVAWVVQEEGVHCLPSGSDVRIFLDARYLFVFDESGPLAAAPDRQSQNTSQNNVEEVSHGSN